MQRILFYLHILLAPAILLAQAVRSLNEPVVDVRHIVADGEVHLAHHCYLNEDNIFLYIEPFEHDESPGPFLIPDDRAKRLRMVTQHVIENFEFASKTIPRNTLEIPSNTVRVEFTTSDVDAEVEFEIEDDAEAERIIEEIVNESRDIFSEAQKDSSVSSLPIELVIVKRDGSDVVLELRNHSSGALKALGQSGITATLWRKSETGWEVSKLRCGTGTRDWFLPAGRTERIVESLPEEPGIYVFRIQIEGVYGITTVLETNLIETMVERTTQVNVEGKNHED